MLRPPLRQMNTGAGCVRDLRQALRQLAERDVHRSRQMSGGELGHLAHIDQQRRLAVRRAQQLLQRARRQAAHARGTAAGGGGSRGSVMVGASPHTAQSGRRARRNSSKRISSAS